MDLHKDIHHPASVLLQCLDKAEEREIGELLVKFHCRQNSQWVKGHHTTNMHNIHGVLLSVDTSLTFGWVAVSCHRVE